MKYRKKPVVVEAIRFWNGGDSTNISACLRFCGKDKLELTEDFYEGGLGLVIPALDRKVNNGDWIIKGEYGEISSCPANIFEKTYEEVKDA